MIKQGKVRPQRRALLPVSTCCLLAALTLTSGCGAPEGSGAQVESEDAGQKSSQNDQTTMGDTTDDCAMVCPTGEQGPQGAQGADGADGSSCSVTLGDDGAVIACTDGTAAHVGGGVLVEGPQGPAGPEGPQGPPGNTGLVGATGAVGSQGPVGPRGPAGADGSFDPSTVYTRVNTSAATTSLSTACDVGDIAISGGCYQAGTLNQLISSFPIYSGETAEEGDTPDGWECQYGFTAPLIRVLAVCVDVP